MSSLLLRISSSSSRRVVPAVDKLSRGSFFSNRMAGSQHPPSHSRSFAAAAVADPALIRTALYDWHVEEHGGDMVSFAGYSLPVLYKGGTNGGVMKEHLWCRGDNQSALFDVSHMGQVRKMCVTMTAAAHGSH